MKSWRMMAMMAMILAFTVVLLGAYTRLTDAGLGCPDWPGCYGHMVLPAKSKALMAAQQLYPTITIESRKAWTEMAHRYAAGTLVLLIVLLNGYACYHRRQQRIPFALCLGLLCLIAFQAALGMWTVTLKLLPIVVMGHLLGGVLIFGGLVLLCWSLHAPSHLPCYRYRRAVMVGLGLIFIQIALGGWVSSNYAGLACLGFPKCNGQLLPSLHWRHSFQIWPVLDANYQGGLLDPMYRVTIQMVHRLGACVVTLYWLIMAVLIMREYPWKRIRWAMALILMILALQWTLGIINVVYLLPLFIAVAHNGVALLLFACVLSLRSILEGRYVYCD